MGERDEEDKGILTQQSGRSILLSLALSRPFKKSLGEERSYIKQDKTSRYD